MPRLRSGRRRYAGIRVVGSCQFRNGPSAVQGVPARREESQDGKRCILRGSAARLSVPLQPLRARRPWESAGAAAFASPSWKASSVAKALRVLVAASFLLLFLHDRQQVADARVKLFVCHELNVEGSTLRAAHFYRLPGPAFKAVCDFTRRLSLALDSGAKLTESPGIAIG